MIRRLARAVFWGSAGLVGYTYIGFPLLVLARARLRPRPHREADVTPRVSMIIAAHDEAADIGAKLDNALALDYPPGHLEIVVASDGSTDATESIVEGYADRGVHLLALPRVGKADALNAAVAASTGEVLVFSDANSRYEPSALRALVRPFADPEVGGVAGNQRYAAGRSGAGERGYWDLDRQMKLAESRAGNVVSATGAIYGIRRSLFRPAPAGVTDDFIISVGVVAQGRRLVFAPDAVAWEPVARSGRNEWARKVRVITRGLRGVLLMRELLDPRRHGFTAVQLVSHKVLRRLMVLPMAAIAVSSAVLWRGGWVYRLAALGQVGLYGLGAAGLALGDRAPGRRKLLAWPAFFILVNAAALRAALNVVSGRRIDRWEPREHREGGTTPARAETGSAGGETLRPDPALDDAHLAAALRASLLAGRDDPVSASIVVPVNAQGDLENARRLLADLAEYAGPHRLEVLLVVNNYPSSEAPPEIAALEALGVGVLAIPVLDRRPGEAAPIAARLPGARIARSEILVLFDADCRIADPTALLDWYVARFDVGRVAAAYTPVGYHGLRSHPSIRARMAAHHLSRWVKRVVLRIPTIRGSNYAIRRDLFLSLRERGYIADDINVGPAVRHHGGRIAYSGDHALRVTTSGRMFRGGWGKLARYLRYRLAHNLRVIPVGPDAARRTGRDQDALRRYVNDEPV